MLREKAYLFSSMKPTLLLILFSCSLLMLSAQKRLRGAFYPVKKDRHFVNEYFVFEGDQVRLTTFGCEGVSTGKGTYTLKRDSLYIHFGESEEQQPFELVDRRKDTSEAKTIHIKAYETFRGGTGPSISAACIVKGTTSIGAVANEEGQIKFIVPDSLTKRALQVSIIGFFYEPVLIPLPEEPWTHLDYSVYFSFVKGYEAGSPKGFNIQKRPLGGFSILYGEDYRIRFRRVYAWRKWRLKKQLENWR